MVDHPGDQAESRPERTDLPDPACSCPEAWLDAKTGLYEGTDFDKAKRGQATPSSRSGSSGPARTATWATSTGTTSCIGAHELRRDLWLDDLGDHGRADRSPGPLRLRPGPAISEAAGQDNPALGRCDGSRALAGPGRGAGEACERVEPPAHPHREQRLLPAEAQRHLACPIAAERCMRRSTSFGMSHLKAVPGHRTACRSSEGMPEVACGPRGLQRRRGHAGDRGAASGPGRPATAQDQGGRVRAADLRPAGDRRERARQRSSTPRNIPIAPGRTDATEASNASLIVHRLREVTALVGYTRFDYISPDIDGEFDLNLERGAARREHQLDPGHREQGRGSLPPVQQGRGRRLEADAGGPGSRPSSWSAACGTGARSATSTSRQFFGAPYVMLHSLSHMLINAISLECGYPASSIKERIYANQNQGYGILLYTAGADSYGTLGGLANAARSLDHYLRLALEMGQLCSNDPVCAQHEADDPNERRYLQERPATAAC